MFIVFPIPLALLLGNAGEPLASQQELLEAVQVCVWCLLVSAAVPEEEEAAELTVPPPQPYQGEPKGGHSEKPDVSQKS